MVKNDNDFKIAIFSFRANFCRGYGKALICSGSSTQFASTSEREKVTMPIDGSANSLNILLTALTDGILDMVGTESILVMFFRR